MSDASTGDGNPLDAWGRGDFRTTTPQALRLLSDNPTTDAVVFCSSDSLDNQALGRPGREEDYARLFAEAAAKSTKPHYFMTMRPGVMHSGQLRILAEAGIAVIGGSRQGLGAIERLGRWTMPLARERASTLAPLPELTVTRRTINEGRCQANSELTRFAGDARDRGDLARGGPRCRRGDRLPGGLEGRIRRHPAQVGAWTRWQSALRRRAEPLSRLRRDA